MSDVYVVSVMATKLIEGTLIIWHCPGMIEVVEGKTIDDVAEETFQRRYPEVEYDEIDVREMKLDNEVIAQLIVRYAWLLKSQS